MGLPVRRIEMRSVAVIFSVPATPTLGGGGDEYGAAAADEEEIDLSEVRGSEVRGRRRRIMVVRRDRIASRARNQSRLGGQLGGQHSVEPRGIRAPLAAPPVRLWDRPTTLATPILNLSSAWLHAKHLLLLYPLSSLVILYFLFLPRRVIRRYESHWQPQLLLIFPQLPGESSVWPHDLSGISGQSECGRVIYVPISHQVRDAYGSASARSGVAMNEYSSGLRRFPRNLDEV